MSKFTVALTFQRRAGYYILQVYIPASFLVILSWLSFFMEASNIADRLALEITMILSTVFLLDGINDSVVHVSYAKASDWFVITSFTFIFVALLETMLVYRLALWEETKAKKPLRSTEVGINFIHSRYSDAQVPNWGVGDTHIFVFCPVKCCHLISCTTRYLSFSGEKKRALTKQSFPHQVFSN